MKINEAYDQWSYQYDTNKNRTRDLEGSVMRELLENKKFDHALEIGCGTGKNTQWLVKQCTHTTGLDFSKKMLDVAQKKVDVDNVTFIQSDITKNWPLGSQTYDLITFSLVLEHIQNLGHIFEQIQERLTPNGIVYIGELHPFKQYLGSKAKYEDASGVHELECYSHHISEFLEHAHSHGLKLKYLGEYFDKGEPPSIPRILGMIFSKK